MGFSNFLKKIFGDQSERAVRPLWDRLKKEINPISEQIKGISNDELRQRITDIKSDIRGAAQQYKDQIEEIRKEIETLDYDKREPLWKKIDELKEQYFSGYAKKLDEVLPEVFAIIKETARRFAQNDIIEVTASEFDRELAAQGKDFVSIEGDKALYKNEWVAGGNLMKWDMVHYDVQLIGGQVLHGIMNNGKASNNIAEMATGEGKTLVATLPVFLNALTGEGVHVVTVNDYLAKRDSEWMVSRWLVSTRLSLTPRNVVLLIRQISHSVPTTSLVSTTFATTWRQQWQNLCNATTITMLSSMRSTQCLSTTLVRR